MSLSLLGGRDKVLKENFYLNNIMEMKNEELRWVKDSFFFIFFLNKKIK